MEQLQSRAAFRETEYYTQQKKELARCDNIAALLTIRAMEDKIIGSLGRPTGSYRPGPILEFVNYDDDVLNAIEILSKCGHSVIEIFSALYNSYIFVESNIAIIYNLSSDQYDPEIVFSFLTVSDKPLMSGADVRVTGSQSASVVSHNNVDGKYEPTDLYMCVEEIRDVAPIFVTELRSIESHLNVDCAYGHSIKMLVSACAVDSFKTASHVAGGAMTFAIYHVWGGVLAANVTMYGGGSGNHVLKALGAKTPKMYAGSYNESLYGGYEAGTMDKMFAGSGNTMIKGHAGNKQLSARANCDFTLKGGSGSDTVYSCSSNHSTIGAESGHVTFNLEARTGTVVHAESVADIILAGSGVVCAERPTWSFYERIKTCIHLMGGSNLRCTIDAPPPVVACSLIYVSFDGPPNVSALDVLNTITRGRTAFQKDACHLAADHNFGGGADSAPQSHFHSR